MAGNVAARWEAWRRRGARTASLRGAAPPALTFPTTTDLQCRVWIALTPDYTRPWWEWGWANITEYVRWDPGITVTEGRRDESGTVESLNGSMVLTNDGRFARKNPFGPYFPHLSKTTPILAEVNPGSGWITQLHGYVPSWPKRWDTTGRDSTSPIEVGGIIRRLQPDSDSRTAMTRTMAGYSASGSRPIAYWPMEDGADAAQFASVIPGVQPMTLGGDITLAVSDGVTGSAPLPIWQAGSNATGIVPEYTDTGTWTAVATVLPPEDLVLQNVAVTVFNAQLTGGNIAAVAVGVSAGAQFVFVTLDSFRNVLDSWVDLYDTSLVLGHPVTVSVTATELYNGINDRWEANLIAADGTILASISENAFAAGDYGRINQITANGRGAFASDTIIGHVGVWVDGVFVPGTDDVQIAKAITGHSGETAAERMARECAAVAIPFTTAGDATTTLGPQPTGTLLDVLRDAEKADGGVLYEHEFGFGYRTLREYCNQPVHLALDQAAGQVTEEIEAEDDDQNPINQWTAKRPDGSSATWRDPAYRDGDLLTPGGSTYNVDSDAILPHIAGWEGNQAVLDEVRWPRISINLAKNPELIPDYAAMPFGGRIQVANPHEESGDTLIDAIYQGKTVHWNSLQWAVDFNTTPASLLNVAVYGTDPGGVAVRYGAKDTFLAVAVDSDDALWTGDPGTDTWMTTESHPSRFPVDLDAGGLTYACTAIAGAAEDGFDRTVVNGWGTSDSGIPWTLSGGTNPGDYDVSPGFAEQSLTSVDVLRHSLLDLASPNQDITVDTEINVSTPTGGSAQSWVAARLTDISNYYAAILSVTTTGVLDLNLYRNFGGNLQQLIPAPVILGSGHSAGDFWSIRLQVVGSQLRVKAWPSINPEPNFWHGSATDTNLTTGTQAGLISRLFAGNTDALPVTVTWANLRSAAPLHFTMTRLPIDKPHAAGTTQIAVTDTGRYGR